MPALNQLAAKAYNGKTYGDFVSFVHVYVVEAHPKAPDPSPYSGKVWELTYSSLPNPKAYAGRVQNAKELLPLITGQQLLLVDALTPEPLDNPVWCSYGTCPNCSFLIRKDGTLQEVIERTGKTLSALETSLLNLLR